MPSGPPEKSEYFVLRSERPAGAQTPSVAATILPHAALFRRLEGFGLGATRQVLTANAVAATHDEAKTLRDDPSNKVVAERLSVALVKPLRAPPGPDGADPGAAALAEAKANRCAWGVAAVGATNSPYDGAGVTVALLDTGVDRSHPAFQGVTFTVKNFTGRGADDDVTDESGHGTHCAGVIFGREHDGVRIGVAPGVTNALVAKVLDKDGQGSTIGVLNALHWAFLNGANIVSMSLGFNYAGRVEELMQEGKPADYAVARTLQAYRENMKAFEQVIAMLGQQGAGVPGALVIAAAGNDSHRDRNPEYVIDVAMPAATLDVLSVGAVRRQGGKFAVADFSNINPVVCAPGFDIVSAGRNNDLAAMSGTSMACPHVAGVAALWWQRALKVNRVARADTVRSMLRGQLKILEELDFVDRGEGLAQAPLGAG